MINKISACMKKKILYIILFTILTIFYILMVGKHGILTWFVKQRYIVVYSDLFQIIFALLFGVMCYNFFSEKKVKHVVNLFLAINIIMIIVLYIFFQECAYYNTLLVGVLIRYKMKENNS